MTTTSGRWKTATREARTTTTEANVRSAPGTTVRMNPMGITQKGRRGWGVERSRDPHWEQTSAVRGFACLREQSFTSYEHAHCSQYTGLPGVIWSQLKQYRMVFFK